MYTKNEYTLYKEVLHDPDNHNGGITHLETDILKCQVKQALGTITWRKLVEMMGFQLSYSKSYKIILWKCCTRYDSKEVHRKHPGFVNNNSITRGSITKSDWLYYLQTKIEKLYLVSKTSPEVDCGSDHELHIAKLRLKLKKVGKPLDNSGMAQSSYEYTVSQFSHSVVSNSATPWNAARQASSTPGIHPRSYQLSWWCHLTI